MLVFILVPVGDKVVIATSDIPLSRCPLGYKRRGADMLVLVLVPVRDRDVFTASDIPFSGCPLDYMIRSDDVLLLVLDGDRVVITTSKIRFSGCLRQDITGPYKMLQRPLVQRKDTGLNKADRQ